MISIQIASMKSKHFVVLRTVNDCLVLYTCILFTHQCLCVDNTAAGVTFILSKNCCKNKQQLQMLSLP